MNGLVNEIESFLIEIVKRPDQHAQFVNTLSLLEYMGARKIFKSQRAETVSMAILSHAADEIRHAKLLKRSALEMSGGRLDSYREEHLLCGTIARHYFQTVDHLSEDQNVQLTQTQKYALTTLLVEERVLQIYPVYERILSQDEKTASLESVIRAILKDEERHMDHVSGRVAEDLGSFNDFLGPLRSSEKAVFQELMQAWSLSLHG